MKKHIVLPWVIPLVFWCLGIQAQSLERSLISTAGELSNAGGIEISATSGEIIIGTANAGSLVFTQGFQQPVQEELVGTIRLEKGKLSVSIFPNPVKNIVTIETKTDKNLDLLFELRDMTGKVLYTTRESITPDLSYISMDLMGYPAGCYFLTIRDPGNGNIFGSFKLLKIR